MLVHYIVEMAPRSTCLIADYDSPVFIGRVEENNSLSFKLLARVQWIIAGIQIISSPDFFFQGNSYCARILVCGTSAHALLPILIEGLQTRII